MTMKLKFLKAHFGIEFKVPEDFFEALKRAIPKPKHKKLAIYSAIQFIPNQKEVILLLKEKGFDVITTKPDRTSFQGQILGCDSYDDNLKLNLNEIDGFIYIGDGYFHPNALLLAQENEEEIKPVVLLNPVQEFCEIISREHIEKYLKKKKANLTKFYTQEIVGVFVSSKWGQEYKQSALKLKEMYPQKQFYYFVSDNFAESEMENFPWIEVWVNTACPRIGQDDITRHSKCVVNIKDIYKR